MKHLGLILVAVALTANFISCKEDKPPTPTRPFTDVYVAGYYTEQGSVRRFPCYWKTDGSRVRLDSDETVHSEATTITVVDGTPHIAGYHYSNTGETQPCVWDENGNRTDITVNGKVRYFSFLGSEPYMAGTDASGACCYWSPPFFPLAGEKKTLLPGCDGISAILVPHNDYVLVAGYWLNDWIQERPKIWVNGEQSIALSDGSTGHNQPVHLSGIARVGTVAYLCGVVKYGLRYQPTYWVSTSDKSYRLPSDPDISGSTSAISASGDKAYVAGLDGSNYCYWEIGGSKTILPGASSVSDIADLNGKVYVSGHSNGVPCYWDKDGKKTVLDVGSGEGATFSIALY